MAQISEHNNSSNNKIHFYNQKRKMVFHLGNNKFEDNNNSTCKLKYLQNSLLMIIVDTPENYVSNVDRKLDKRKISTSSIKSASTYFFFQYIQCVVESIIIQKNVLC